MPKQNNEKKLQQMLVELRDKLIDTAKFAYDSGLEFDIMGIRRNDVRMKLGPYAVNSDLSTAHWISSDCYYPTNWDSSDTDIEWQSSSAEDC